MIGTTHFTNAIVERRRLVQVAGIRLGLPATRSLPPMTDWPNDLAMALGRHRYMVIGGNEFDGREIAPLDEKALREIAREMKQKKITAAAISSVFSPVTSRHGDPGRGDHRQRGSRLSACRCRTRSAASAFWSARTPPS